MNYRYICGQISFLMGADNNTLTLFALRVRQMILRFGEMKKENEELRNTLDARNEEIKQLHEKIEQARRDYENLKTARLLAVADGDVDSAKKRLASLIREVNKCITLLSEK